MRRDLGLECRVEIGRRHDAGQQAERRGLCRIEHPAREHHPPRRRRPHAGHDIGADRRGDEAEPRLGQPEARAFRPDREVADRHEAHAAAEGVALHPRDERLGDLIERAQHHRKRARAACARLGVGLDLRLHPGQIAPGAETLALGPEHHDPHRLIRAEARGGLGQLRDHPGRKGVVLGPARERQLRHAACVAADAQRLHLRRPRQRPCAARPRVFRTSRRSARAS